MRVLLSTGEFEISIFDSLPIGVVYFNAKGRLDYHNEKLRVLVGSPISLRGMGFGAFNRLFFAGRLTPKMLKDLLEQGGGKVCLSMETGYGFRVDSEVTVYGIKSNDNCLEGMLLLVGKERKFFQKLLEQENEKLTGLGFLVGVELQDIQGNLKAAEHFLKLREEKVHSRFKTKTYLGDICRELSIARHKVDELLELTGENGTEFKCNPQESLDYIINSMAPEICRRGISILKHYRGFLPEIALGKDYFQALVGSLLFSLAKVVPENGLIMIDAECRQLQRGVTLEIKARHNEGAKDFEEVCNLAVCRWIVGRCDGLLDITSIPGTGIKIKLEFPALRRVQAVE